MRAGPVRLGRRDRSVHADPSERARVVRTACPVARRTRGHLVERPRGERVRPVRRRSTRRPGRRGGSRPRGSGRADDLPALDLGAAARSGGSTVLGRAGQLASRLWRAAALDSRTVHLVRRLSGRRRPASISAARASREAYIGVSTPEVAHSTSRPSPSALRATCARTWPAAPARQRGGRSKVGLAQPSSGLQESSGGGGQLVQSRVRLRSSSRGGGGWALTPRTVAAVELPGRRLSVRPTSLIGLTYAYAAPDSTLTEGPPVAERLIVRGAREHNLKDVSLDLPRDALIVFTGLSGSGKSSLAFDTIFAEGQRRYVESLSAYARQFLGQMDKPDVDFIEGLSPAVSIDQKSTNRNPGRRSAPSRRSTTTCACSTRGPAGRTAPRADGASDGRHRRPSSIGCSSSTTVRASRCWRRWCVAGRASTASCSRSSRPRATAGLGSTVWCTRSPSPQR